MRAMVYRSYGGPENLQLESVARPAPGKGQVLVRVRATAVNPVDWKIASGKMRPLLRATFPCIPGFDLAGEVVEAGDGVVAWKAGMRVHARIAAPGACAEYAVADATLIARMPDEMTWEQGAALPLAGMTALQGLRDRGGLPLDGATQRVLIVGASGGVGHLAVQIAVASGAHVTGVCSARNLALVSGLGAQETIDYTRQDPFRGVAPFDLVYDCVAGDPAPYWPLVAPGGAYLSCMPGVTTFAWMLGSFFTGRRVWPVLLRGTGSDLELLDRLFERGALRPVLDRQLDLEQLPAAWERSISGRATGKIVLRV